MKLKDILREAGVVGAGGAGFPTYAKLGEGIDTLLINAAECEPLLFTDYTILTRELVRVCDGAALMAEALGAQTVLLGIKAHRAAHLGWEDGTVLQGGVKVCALPDIYPLGDEINLIYEMTGRLVQPGCLPLTQHVVVSNVETLWNVSRAVREHLPVTEKWVTVSGDVPDAARQVVRVPVGMRVADLFAALGVTVPDTHVCIDGGPSMGRIISHQTAVIGKNTKGLLVLPRDIPATVVKLRTPDRQRMLANAVCCQCSACTEMCPRALLGYPLEPHRLVRAEVGVVEAFPDKYASAALCSGCGVCEIAACCQGISPKAVIAAQKAVLGKNRIRFQANREYGLDPDRNSRLIPSARWRNLLGVAKYHIAPAYGGFLSANEVSVSLKGHIGVSARACVKVGDAVVCGQPVAAAAEGLSVAHHASLDGKVSFIDENAVYISKA